MESFISKNEEKQINNNVLNTQKLHQNEILYFINNNNFGDNNIEKYKIFIKDKINKLMNLKDMEKDEISKSLNDLQNLMMALLESNYKLREKAIKSEEKIIKLEEKFIKLEEKVNKFEKDNDSLKEDVDSLKYENEEIKSI